MITVTGFAQRPHYYTEDPNLSEAKDYRQRAQLQIGGGVLVTGRPYKGIDSRVIGIPFIRYGGKNWSFKGTQFDYDFLSADAFSVTGLVKLRTEGYDADDSSDLRGMDDREVTLDSGVRLAYEQRWGTVRFVALSDILGKNKGQELIVSYSKAMYEPFNFKKVILTPFVGAEWRTTSLNNYYYGVRPEEAAAGRSPYTASEDTNIFLGISCNWQYKKDAALFTMIRNTWLGDQIRRSPIVDQDYAISVVAGLIWDF